MISSYILMTRFSSNVFKAKLSCSQNTQAQPFMIVCSAPQKLDTKVPVLILTVVVVGEPTNVAHIQPG